MFYAHRMTQIHQFCTRKDQEKKLRAVCFIFKHYNRWCLLDDTTGPSSACDSVRREDAYGIK